MKIAVLGAGALGCAIGGSLAEAGNDVVLINRNPAHVDAIRAHGLRMRGGGRRALRGGARRTGLRGARAGRAGHRARQVLPHAGGDPRGDAADRPRYGRAVAAERLGGHEDILAEAVGRERVIAGKTYVGGVMLGPGHIISGTEGKETLIASWTAATARASAASAATFEAAGPAHHGQHEHHGHDLGQATDQCGHGRVSGITGLPYGPLYATCRDRGDRRGRRAGGDGRGPASGVPLSHSDPKAPWAKAAAGLPDDFKTSMLQSLEKGSITRSTSSTAPSCAGDGDTACPPPSTPRWWPASKASNARARPAEAVPPHRQRRHPTCPPLHPAHEGLRRTRRHPRARHPLAHPLLLRSAGHGRARDRRPHRRPAQYWTLGGLQLMATPDFQAPPSNDAGWLAPLA